MTLMEKAGNAMPAVETQSVTERTMKATKTALATKVAAERAKRAPPAMLLTSCFALASAELVAPTELGNAIQKWLESETACAAVV